MTDTVVGAAGAAGVDAWVGAGDEYEDEDEDEDDDGDEPSASDDDGDGDADGPAGWAPPWGGMMHAVAAMERRAAARDLIIIIGPDGGRFEESHPSGFARLGMAVINVRLPPVGERLVSNGHMQRMPSNESSDLEHQLAVLANVMQHRTVNPATARFVRGTLDEGDTQPFALEEPTQQSMPYDRVEVEMEVDLGTAPAPKYPPAVELQLSASKNLVMDTVQIPKVIAIDLAPKKKIPTTKKMAATPRPTHETKTPNARRARATTARTTQKTKAVTPGPTPLAMTLAFVFGAVAFLLGLGLARLMM